MEGEMMDTNAHRADCGTNHRARALWIYAIAVLLWTMVGTSMWAGLLKPLGVLGAALALPVGVTTWPAHEALLEMSGAGFGANALTQPTPAAFIVFLLWAGVLWSPLIVLYWRKLPCLVGVGLQAVLLIATFGLFWRFGNG